MMGVSSGWWDSTLALPGRSVFGFGELLLMEGAGPSYLRGRDQAPGRLSLPWCPSWRAALSRPERWPPKASAKLLAPHLL